MQHLRFLALCYCFGGISSLTFKTRIPNLRNLKLERVTPWMTNEELAILAENCADLVELSLVGCPLLDFGKLLVSQIFRICFLFYSIFLTVIQINKLYLLCWLILFEWLIIYRFRIDCLAKYLYYQTSSFSNMLSASFLFHVLISNSRAKKIKKVLFLCRSTSSNFKWLARVDISPSWGQLLPKFSCL